MIKKTWLITLVIFSSITSQTIQINEVIASNQNTFYDEDGDTPDWIELYNPSTNNVSIHNWGLSDDTDNPFKWRFPNMTLGSDQYLLIMASNKNRTNIIAQWETIINWGDEWDYFIGTQAPPLSWNQIGFNTINWNTGPSGFGYGDNDDNTVISPVISVYLVKTFFISNSEHVKKIALHIDYDDAFVAYLNSVEFARANITGSPPSYNQGAEIWREAEMYNGGSPELYWVDSSDTWLSPGVNVLAIQVHNYNSNSSDMSCIPFLTVGRDTIIFGESGVADEITLPGSMLHTNFKISSTGETIVITDSDSLLLDSLYTGNLLPDVSIGRVDDGENIGMFITPTPGNPNGSESVLGVLSELTYSHFSGFYDELFLR